MRNKFDRHFTALCPTTVVDTTTFTEEKHDIRQYSVQIVISFSETNARDWGAGGCGTLINPINKPI